MFPKLTYETDFLSLVFILFPSFPCSTFPFCSSAKKKTTASHDEKPNYEQNIKKHRNSKGNSNDTHVSRKCSVSLKIEYLTNLPSLAMESPFSVRRQGTEVFSIQHQHCNQQTGPAYKDRKMELHLKLLTFYRFTFTTLTPSILRGNTTERHTGLLQRPHNSRRVAKFEVRTSATVLTK